MVRLTGYLAPYLADGSMKCQYIGSWSGAGCNNDVSPGERYCHQHRMQGPANSCGTQAGCLAVILMVVVAVIVTCS